MTDEQCPRCGRPKERKYFFCNPCAALMVDFEERAAIREYDGGMSREDAERLAKEDLDQYFNDLST